MTFDGLDMYLVPVSLLSKNKLKVSCIISFIHIY